MDDVVLDQSRRELRVMSAAAGLEFFRSMADWRSMLTLTFENPTGGDVAMVRWRGLVRYLNWDAFGKHYTQRVGHSYFSYVLGVERQRRDVIHFHAVIGSPVKYDQVHWWWNKYAGWAWISGVESVDSAVGYVTKYVLKGGEVHGYRSRTSLVPSSLTHLQTQ